ncbi:Ig-like V-type domain-containing protein FAM187A [Spea bombifrons]|uniref:Ig-like V-type domain-containing protein FAM187A n=1 Tax=Spea bombifrons TaxID=233779 RepID=UPI00234BBB67|nr:Ig-like V-type domain-containing protein FAM187A [Spea bombifrons]
MAHASLWTSSPLWVVAIFCILSPAQNFEIIEKEDIYSVVPCPAFLLFDSVAYLADMTFELPCNRKPDNVHSVVWYYQRNLGAKDTRILTRITATAVDSKRGQIQSVAHLSYDIKMFNLIVFQAQPEESGHYICGTLDGQYFYGYNVDIQPSRGAHITFADKHANPQPELKMNDFTAFTALWEWSKCDRCDVRGEQRRLGMCYLQSPYIFPRNRVSKADVAPCGSGAVPARFKPYLADRKTEILIRSCETPCYKAKKGFFGKLQSLMHSLYKLKKHIPFIPKAPTQVHTHALGENLVLACPDAKPHHSVAWDKDKERLYLADYLIGQKGSMRVFIDHGNHLNIHSVERGDKGIYYCWLDGKLKAGFRLNVVRDPLKQRKFTDPDSIYTMKTIGLTALGCLGLFLIIHCLKCISYNFRCIPFMND